MTDTFMTPDDDGPIKASDFTTSPVEQLGARAAEAFHDLPVPSLVRAARQAHAGGEDLAVGTGGEIDTFGNVPLQQQQDVIDRQKSAIPDISKDDAKALLKQEGLSESDVPLGAADSHKLPVLKLRIEDAHAQRDREAAIERGPQNFFATALGFVTSLGVGMVDPINLAAFSIPVLGEARMGKILASAGESMFGRAAVRAGEGAAKGAVGMTALQPLDWWLHTHDGHDYTMSEAMQSIVMGAGMGAAFHALPGAYRDWRTRRQGLPLEGTALDRVLREMPRIEQPEPPGPATAHPEEEVPGISPEAPTAPETAPLARPEETVPTPGEVLADLPEGVRQDAVHSAMAALIEGKPVQTAEILDIAASHDPRIAETVDPWNAAGAAARAEPLTPQAARQAIADDVRQKLRAAGLSEEEADANAAVTAARYNARAARLGTGQSALDLYRGENLSIRNDGFGFPGEAGRAFAQRRPQEPGLFAEREAEGQASLLGTERIGPGELAQRGADAPLKPGVAQKPLDVGLFGDDAAQKSFFQSQPQAPPFYSAIDRAVTSSRQDKATPEQWLGTLKNAAGVKPEEMKWLGLEDWLKEQKGSVTRQQLQDYVRANAIEVKEVAKGAAIDKHPALKAVENENTRVTERYGGLQEGWEQMTPQEYERHTTIHSDASEVRDAKAEELYGKPFHMLREFEQAAVDHDLNGGATDAKFPSYTLPGGENYRELLLTLPERQPAERAAAQSMNEALSEKYGSLTEAFQRWTEEEREAFDNVHGAASRVPEAANYTSSHWEEPNVLAHIRFDDRVSDGKRTLHLAEVQSDWHQAGKRRGYQRASEGRSVDEIDREITALRDEAEKEGPLESAGDWQRYRDEHPEWVERDRQLFDERTRIRNAEESGVPDAPFKTTWPELSMKRMIRYAAEHGYDRVSWDTGATNAERYDLSKKIQAVRWNETTGDLQAKDHNGEVVLRKTAAAAELPDIIGKEAAQKLIEQKPVEVKLLPAVHQQYLTVEQAGHQYIVTNVDGREVKVGKGTVGSETEAKEYAERHLNKLAKEINERRELEGQRVGMHREISGLDLKVGGEGMAGFYDRILPATVNKLVKKFGAKVEEGSVATEQAYHTSHFVGAEPTRAQIAQVAEAVAARPTDQRFVSPVTGERQGYQINRANNEMAMRQVRQAMNEGASFSDAMGAHATHDLAEVFGGKIEVRNKIDEKTEPVHSLDLTPELRQAAMQQGFPLFQGGGEAPRGRITLSDNAAIIDLFRGRDASTFMHESGHLWLDELLRDAAHPDAPAPLRADRDAVLNWLGVKDASEIGTAQHEKWAEGFEQYLRSGEAPSSALAKAFEAFQRWIGEIYRALSNAGEPIPREIRGVMDRMLATEAEIADRGDELNASTREVKKTARGRAAADPQTWSLFEYLASKGGLKPDPELHAIFGGKRGPMVGGFGPLLRNNGMPLDEALRVAKEGHYLFDAGDVSGAEANLTPRDLLDTVDRESRGRKVYRMDHVTPDREIAPEEEAKHIVDALHDELEASSGQKGIEIDPKLEARVVEIIRHEGVHDVLVAYERAIMETEEAYNAAADARAKESRDAAIPGWDVPADAGAAPQGRPAAAADRGPAGRAGPGDGAGAGGEPRATGTGDRTPGQAELGPRKSTPEQAAADPRWRELSEAKPDYDDPETLAESEAAAKLPEPASTEDPKKSLTALEKAAADAEGVWRQLEPTLTEAERTLVTDVMDQLKLDAETRNKIISDGAACLAGAIA